MTEAGLISVRHELRKCGNIISIKSPAWEILQKEPQQQKKKKNIFSRHSNSQMDMRVPDHAEFSILYKMISKDLKED